MNKQRQATIDEFFLSSPTELRPIMTLLNGDNSWLFSFPRPASERKSTGKAYFHIIFEPWLDGPAIQWNSWLVWMSLTKPAAIPDCHGVENLARQIEEAAMHFLGEPAVVRGGQITEGKYDGYLDIILLSLDQSDHVHEPTLRTFNKHIPVVATTAGAKAVKALDHFESVSLIPSLDSSATTWQAQHPDALPSWLQMVHLPGKTFLNYCLALIWTHPTDDGSEIHDAILYSPHGTPLDQGPFQAFLDAEPTQKLAMLHGLKESTSAGIQTTLGVRGGLEMYRKVGGVKYWLLSHHSDLSYAGMVMRLLNVTDTNRTLEWGLEDEEKRHGKEFREKGGKPNMVQVENGGSFVLV